MWDAFAEAWRGARVLIVNRDLTCERWERRGPAVVAVPQEPLKIADGTWEIVHADEPTSEVPRG
jgi:hypothetical protein